jgi:hypothetical protein
MTAYVTGGEVSFERRLMDAQAAALATVWDNAEDEAWNSV